MRREHSATHHVACAAPYTDLVDMLGKLVNDRKGQFDHILIETTGLANPAPIIQTFYLEPDLLDSLRLDVVTPLTQARRRCTSTKRSPRVSSMRPSSRSRSPIVWWLTRPTSSRRLRSAPSRTVCALSTSSPPSSAQARWRWTSTLSSHGSVLIAAWQDVEQEPEAHSHFHSHDHDHSRDAEGGGRDLGVQRPEPSSTYPTHDHGHAPR